MHSRLDALKTHTPQIWGVEIPPPPNLRGESSKNTCFTVFSGAPSLNWGGEIFTPQIWGVWVLRVVGIYVCVCVCLSLSLHMQSNCLLCGEEGTLRELDKRILGLVPIAATESHGLC